MKKSLKRLRLLALLAAAMCACQEKEPVAGPDAGTDDDAAQPADTVKTEPKVAIEDQPIPEYELYFEDEFDDMDAVGNNWWCYATENPSNSELQRYSGDNLSFGEDPLHGRSCMILTARRDTCEDCSNNQYLKSAKVSTQYNKAACVTTYGRVEASIMLPKTYKGLWPAFWMMGTDIGTVGWPRCGEIDIMEFGHSGGFASEEKAERYFNGACHWGTSHQQSSKFYEAPYSLQDGEFHQYTLIWTSQSIRCYLDMDSTDNPKPYFALDITGNSYFHKDFYLLLNLAVGGQYPGIYDPAGVTALAPVGGEASMYIDYVRIYREKE